MGEQGRARVGEGGQEGAGLWGECMERDIGEEKGKIMNILKFLSGENMMKFLVCCYILTATLFALQRNWPKMMYWVGAATITSSVIFMK